MQYKIIIFGGGIVFFLLLIILGGVVLQQKTRSESSDRLLPPALPIGKLGGCLENFLALREKLYLKEIGGYKNIGVYHPSPEALDASREAPIRESENVKDSLYARYYYYATPDTIDTILDVNVVEFESKVELQRISNNLKDLENNIGGESFTTFYSKYIEGKTVYFIEQKIVGEQIQPGGSVEKQEAWRLDIYMQIPERNSGIHFTFHSASFAFRRVSAGEAEAIFLQWLSGICESDWFFL